MLSAAAKLLITTLTIAEVEFEMRFSQQAIKLLVMLLLDAVVLSACQVRGNTPEEREAYASEPSD